MHVLELLGCRLGDGDARLARAGEGDHRHVGMPDERVAGLLAVAVDDVDDARREARFAQKLDEALGETAGCPRPV